MNTAHYRINKYFVLLIYFMLSCTSTPKRLIETNSDEQSNLKFTEVRKPASLAEQMNKIDSRKPTVCTVTINSSEEREVFRNKLKNFNHIELADVSDQIIDNSTRGGRWFENACSKGIQCDILVLSGHFAGTFFGITSDLKLPAETLEKMTCNPGCDGILKKPKEVFLFGCNTLAGKNADSRSPEEYIRVLIDDGFSVLEAQQTAALRYSPVGNSFYDRMSRIFSDSPKIYGFSSKGPSGRNVKNLLENYFSKFPDYSYHLSKVNKEGTNDAWANALKVTVQAQTSGRTTKVNFCPIYDKKISYVDKLKLIKTLMEDESNFLENIPLVSKFVEMEYENKNQSAPKSQEELFLISSIQKNEKTRNAIHKFLTTKTPGMMRIQVSMLNIARYFSLWPESYTNQIQRNLVGDLRNHSTQERFEVILLQQITLPELKLEDLPQDSWNQWDMAGISLLKPSDIRISRKLSEYLKNKELSERAMISIASLDLYGDDIISNVINYGRLFINNIESLRNNGTFDTILSYLNKAPKNEDLIIFYVELMNKVRNSNVKYIPGSLFSELEYFSKNKIHNQTALDLALYGWEEGQGGRGGWYSYRYLTSNPPCLQLQRLKLAEDNLYKNRVQWNAYSDESFDATMGATPKLTENFKEAELYQRIYNTCK